MRLTTVFTDHPHALGETYGEHCKVALSFAGPLAVAAGAALVHAFFPFLLKSTASRTVGALNDRMTSRCARCPSKALKAIRPGLSQRAA